jgi:L-threonylcarbamoyladenylate synthase
VKTLLTTSADEAGEIIKRGGIVAFPTETVYGLGADVFCTPAIERIFEAKRRPPDNPLIAHVGETGQIGLLADPITESARLLINAFFPGPLTVVLRKTAGVPSIATAGLDTIGIRMPRHPTARKLLLACGTPLVAPSANVSGKPSPTTWQAVFEDLDGRIDCILRGEPTEIGLESTVVDCTGEVPVVLRRGAISIDDLGKVVPTTRESSADDIREGRSPGLRHRHYSPVARVVLVEPGETLPQNASSAFIGITARDDGFAHTKICRSVENYAKELFEFFRECDRRGIETIYCETVPEAGIGAALMDRLRRAADAG